MSERYTRLFALEENLYSEGSPIVISAGALLKDNRTGAVLAQLKIKNISRKVIKAAIVCLTAYDAFGKIIDGTVEKEYLDLAVERDAEFGQKVLIPLPNAAARAFTAAVTCVGFADNTAWNYAGEEQTALPHPKLLAETLGESELMKQYQIKYGVRAKVFPEAYKDVWFCACGALCRADEGICHTCGNKRSELLSFDRKALTAEKDERLEKEAAARKKAEEKAEAARRKAEEEAAAAAAKRAKRAKKATAIGIPVICACIAFMLLLTQVIVPKMQLNKAMGMIDAGDYDAAYVILEELENNKAITASKYERAMERIDARDYETALALLDGLNYKDSEEQIAVCQTAILDEKYNAAMKLFQEKRYEEAREAFQALKGHRDSKKMEAACKDALQEIAFNEAMTLFQNGAYREAYAAFSAIPSKESREQRKAILSVDPTVEYYFANVGDTVSFGRYEQDNNRNNGAEDIKWTVLAKEGKRLLLISKYDIEYLPYNSGGGNVTWETCSLRRWLNSTFLTTAFTKDEQSLIPKVTVRAEKAPGFSDNPGKNTEDRVFILSGTEAKKFFPNLWDGGTSLTNYTLKIASSISPDIFPSNYDGNVGWWVRSPGNEKDTAVFVGADGLIEKDYCFWVGWPCGIRPVLWIDLNT